MELTPRFLTFVVGCAAFTIVCREAPPVAPPPPTALTLDERVDSLLLLMTLDEKIG